MCSLIVPSVVLNVDGELELDENDRVWRFVLLVIKTCAAAGFHAHNHKSCLIANTPLYLTHLLTTPPLSRPPSPFHFPPHTPAVCFSDNLHIPLPQQGVIRTHVLWYWMQQEE